MPTSIIYPDGWHFMTRTNSYLCELSMKKFHKLGDWLDVNDLVDHIFFDFLTFDMYSKTRVKRALKNQKDKAKVLITIESLMKIKSSAECCKRSILQYF